MNDPGATDRSRILVLFTLSGATLGVNLAMLCCTDHPCEYGRTDIGKSFLLTMAMTAVGFAIGDVLSQFTPSASISRTVSAAVLLLTFLLGGAFGWLSEADYEARCKAQEKGTAAPPIIAMAEGGFIGAFLGLLVLTPRRFAETIARINGVLRRKSSRAILIVAVTAIGIVATAWWGRIPGLNALGLCALTSFLASIPLQNRFFLLLAVAIVAVDLFLTSTTTSPPISAD
jgi:hypothetical protein